MPSRLSCRYATGKNRSRQRSAQKIGRFSRCYEVKGYLSASLPGCVNHAWRGFFFRLLVLSTACMVNFTVNCSCVFNSLIWALRRIWYTLRSFNFSDHILDSNSGAAHPPVSRTARHQTPFRLIPVVVEVRRMHLG